MKNDTQNPNVEEEMEESSTIKLLDKVVAMGRDEEYYATLFTKALDTLREGKELSRSDEIYSIVNFDFELVDNALAEQLAYDKVQDELFEKIQEFNKRNSC